MAATVRGGRRRVQVSLKSLGSSLFFFSSRGLHSSSSVSFVFVVFCVSGEAVASSSEYDGEKEVKVRSLFFVRAMLPFMVDSHIFPFFLS